MKKAIALAGLLLCSCSFRRHEIVFDEPGTLRVNEKYNACEFVKSVDGKMISNEMIQDGKIVVSDDLYISCNGSFSPEKIGEHLLEYMINGSQNESFSVNVVDDIAPEIAVKKESYEVEEGNDYFDINNEVSFSDNYDREFLHSLDHSIDINTVGEYEVIAYARDSSGNEAKKIIPVKVVEKQKEIETVYVHSSSSGANSPAVAGQNQPSSSTSHSNSEAEGHSSSGGSSSSDTSSSASPSAAPALPPAEAESAPSGISGVHSISVPVGTDFNSIYFQLSDISCSSSVSIDASEVNTSVPGSYTVYYYAADGSSASCTVSVY